MIPRAKMKLESKGKNFQASLSALFSRRKEASGQLAGNFFLSFSQNNQLKHSRDHAGDAAMSAPPRIVTEGESSEGQRRRQYAENVLLIHRQQLEPARTRGMTDKVLCMLVKPYKL
jgi:hypothetical protein